MNDFFKSEKDFINKKYNQYLCIMCGDKNNKPWENKDGLSGYRKCQKFKKETNTEFKYKINDELKDNEDICDKCWDNPYFYYK